MEPLPQKIKEVFIKKYKQEPLMVFSPGRINLMGEHIDYNDGYVMPCTIGKGIYFAVSPSNTDTIRFYARNVEEDLSVKLNDLPAEDGWCSYMLGVVDQIQKDGKNIKGFDCVFGGDLPIGAGLASSAALTGGLAFGLNEIFNFGYDRIQLAQLCQKAEIEFAGVNCGIMDPYVNMTGRKNELLFLDCKNLRHNYIPLALEGYSMVLINANVHHALASSVYNTRRSECETGLKVIRENSSFKSFRDIRNAKTLERFEEQMGKYVWKRTTFVVEEIQRTKLAAKYLKRKKLKEFGELMFQSHEGLSNLFKVSCAELDFLVKKARANDDVLGARMMGGGFGGCTINLVKHEGKQKFVKETLAAYKEEFQNSAESYAVVSADATHLLFSES